MACNSSSAIEDSVNVGINSKSLIMFDLETTGFGNDGEILQISAVYKREEFNVYTKPTRAINFRATEINKLSLNNNNDLCYDGNVVDSVNLLEGLKMFLSWLEVKVPRSRILMGHNIKTCDCPIIMKALSEHELKLNFCRLIDGFVDTLTVFKIFCPKENVRDYQQITLVNYYLSEPYEAHNALEDVKILQKLVFHSKILEEEQLIQNHTIEPHYFSRKISYRNMISRKIISDSYARKLAEKNISYNDLLFYYKIGGEEVLGRSMCRSKKLKRLSKPQIRITAKICDYFRRKY